MVTKKVDVTSSKKNCLSIGIIAVMFVSTMSLSASVVYTPNTVLAIEVNGQLHNTESFKANEK